jgi:hypothetical protein
VSRLRHTSLVDATASKTLSPGEVRLWVLVVATAVVASESWGVAGAVVGGVLAALVGVTASELAPATLTAAALGTAGAGAVHLAVATPHVHEWWGYGAFFVACGWVQLAWAAIAPRRVERRLLWVGLAGNLVVVLVWAVSRIWGLPLGPAPGEAEAIGAPDVVATVLESVAAAACLAALWRTTPPAGRLRLVLGGAALAVTAYGLAAAAGAH